ncbi:MAG: glycine cleavage system protein GcvH [Chloroflexota bacterium]
MATTPAELRYNATHEWARRDGDLITVGITDHAQDQLGDVIYVELPEIGRTLARGDTFGAVDSVKTYSELYAPLGGEVVEVNTALADTPEAVNHSPYEDGWMMRLRPAHDDEWDTLLDADAYERHVAAEQH